MSETCERISENYLSRDMLLSQYVTRAFNAVKARESGADHEDLITVLRNFRSEVARQTLADLLTDIKEVCEEHTYKELQPDSSVQTFRYYTIDVEEVEELIKRAKKL